MKGLEKIKHKGKDVAFIIRNNITIKKGVHFFTAKEDPLQLAIHSYKLKKETKIHNNKVVNPVKQTKKYKYIYIIKGIADIELMAMIGKVSHKIRLKRGDSIIIMDIFHKVIFSPKSSVFEVKQGPYTND